MKKCREIRTFQISVRSRDIDQEVTGRGCGCALESGQGRAAQRVALKLTPAGMEEKNQ
jgi:hypothetical protein